MRKADVQVSLRPAFDLRHYWRLRGPMPACSDTAMQRACRTISPDARDRMAYFSLGYSFVLDQRDSRAYPLSGTVR